MDKKKIVSKKVHTEYMGQIVCKKMCLENIGQIANKNVGADRQ